MTTSPLSDPSGVLRQELPGGVRLLVEPMAGVRSAAVGVMVLAGSRHEAPDMEGAAHFLEHMAFKGTTRRSALDIARELDRLGGLANAYTARELTCFHARVADTGLAQALDVLADLALHPTLAPADVELEKTVVLQEQAQVEETPEEWAAEAFWAALWRERTMGHPILGSPATVGGFSPDSLATWRAGHYVASRLLIAVAGAVDPGRFGQQVAELVADLPRLAPPPAPAPGGYTRVCRGWERDAEQGHLFLGFPAPGFAHEQRWAVSLLSALLGGQMSSRLFQEVREKRGLAYDISSSITGDAHEGLLQIYAAVAPERLAEALTVIRAELEAVAGNGLDARELDHAKEHLTGLLWLSAESTEERMLRLARNEIIAGRQISLAESVSRLSAVTLDELRHAARSILDLSQVSLGVLAPEIDPAWAGLMDSAFHEDPY